MLKHPLIRKAEASSKVKVWHIVRVTHRDEVEPPLTDWLKEAYDVSETLKAPKAKASKTAKSLKKRKKPSTKTLKKKKRHSR